MNMKNKPRVNEAITARFVKLIDDQGNVLGEYGKDEALALAYEKGLDLIELNSDSNPPVCKMIDYGKQKYLMQKKKQESKKKQKTIVIKELYVHLGIGQHDYNVRLKQLQNFIQEGLKVKIGVKFRGRERIYQDKGLELLNRFYEDVGAENVKLDVAPKLEGNNAIVVFSPLNPK